MTMMLRAYAFRMTHTVSMCQKITLSQRFCSSSSPSSSMPPISPDPNTPQRLSGDKSIDSSRIDPNVVGAHLALEDISKHLVRIEMEQKHQEEKREKRQKQEDRANRIGLVITSGMLLGVIGLCVGDFVIYHT